MTPLVRVHCIPMGRKIVFLPERFRTKIAYVGANLVVNCSFVLIEVALLRKLVFAHLAGVWSVRFVMFLTVRSEFFTAAVRSIA